MLTDAMVRKIARASHLALASAGHILVRDTETLGPYRDGSDLFDIIFPHRNYNQVTQPGSRHPQIVRVVGGRIEHLRATNLVGLNKDLRSLNITWQPLVQLDIWVDSSGVIRFMELHDQGPSQPTGLTDRITVTIKFLDIGKPETILAPAHYGRAATHD
jgi:hypothetical protein